MLQGQLPQDQFDVLSLKSTTPTFDDTTMSLVVNFIVGDVRALKLACHCSLIIVSVPRWTSNGGKCGAPLPRNNPLFSRSQQMDSCSRLMLQQMAAILRSRTFALLPVTLILAQGAPLIRQRGWPTYFWGPSCMPRYLICKFICILGVVSNVVRDGLAARRTRRITAVIATPS